MLSLICKHVQHVKIYLPCTFAVNPITHFAVIALFSSIFFKLKQQTCSACQDLPTLQYLSKSHYPSWSYCPFFIIFFLNFNTFRPLFKKL